jgi:hypothetical protein
MVEGEIGEMEGKTVEDTEKCWGEGKRRKVHRLTERGRFRQGTRNGNEDGEAIEEVQ